MLFRSGTERGITALQMDIKIAGVSIEIMRTALQKARAARLFVLGKMRDVIEKPRTELSPYAPRFVTIKIRTEKIREIIGPGGKVVRGIQDATGAKIDIEDDGTVFIAAVGMEAAEKAREEIERLSEDVKIGKVYTGKVTSIKDFGAFIEVIPGQDGLCHISELADRYLKTVGEEVKLGQTVRVKVIAIDDQGRIKLSRKQAMRDENPKPAAAPAAPGAAPQAAPAAAPVATDAPGDVG